MEVIKAVKFKYHEDLDELFKDFKEMLEFCTDKALKLGITSYAKLRNAIYEEWKQKWYPKYHTHYRHSACKIATAILKNFRKRKKKGLTNKDRPEIKRNFIKLEEVLFKFEGDKIRIVTAPRSYVTIKLIVGEYQQRFVETWKGGEFDIGESIIKQGFIVI
ncbi:MAG: RNA-guided endonuclease InsQ/TnpB family protein, partial [Candidatus Baldrarchaeia archaeon]